MPAALGARARVHDARAGVRQAVGLLTLSSGRKKFPRSGVRPLGPLHVGFSPHQGRNEEDRRGPTRSGEEGRAPRDGRRAGIGETGRRDRDAGTEAKAERAGEHWAQTPE